ncbi:MULTISPECIES: primosomal protein N' [Marinomonas]|uniref:Replication restart protein PriA n=1 Tax=Marinomonas arctica TaxID=383750 RepID=A0A7H1J5N6_9GAMM|nr:MULTISPECIES: primosomal protein N' [Marinomonas]MCS7488443.1 preprotein translocase subunit SecA [Marinomonas sp. BSi20414]QNT05802.1 primosomal protein N' [Marinomonas arctica]GGN38977.1 primosomal protein N' [Marinomonas arctica]
MSEVLLTLSPYIKVALPVPMRTLFDYKVPKAITLRHELKPGMRVKVPFGKSSRLGVIVALSDHSEWDPEQIKPLTSLHDKSPVISAELMALCEWAARYYHHPIGDVIFHALPILLRKGENAEFRTENWWFTTEKGQAISLEQLSRAPRQQDFLKAVQQHPNGLSQHAASVLDLAPSAAKILEEKGLLRKEPRSFNKGGERHAHVTQIPPTLNMEQMRATEHILDYRHQFHVALLDGVTGSGKTEVFLRVMARLIEEGKQILVMVPEIGLTPQTLKRFENRFNTDIVLMHSNMSDRERLDAWLLAASGHAKIIIGTRSAAFIPAPNLGLIVIDEEHDTSYKQHEGFRYHARDLAIKRAQALNIPVLLASATPSYESLTNALQKRFAWLKLRQRAGNAQIPKMERVDLRGKSLVHGFSEQALVNMKQCLERKEQVLVFLNRRGYAPTLMCHQCGWIAACDHCDVNLTVHKRANKLHCHHCDTQKALIHTCPECQSEELFTVGEGTEQIETQLSTLFKEVPILRIDRDSTQRKSAMAKLTQKIHEHDQAILIGTQMLAKGHHFPNVTLVIIMDADAGLFSSDFRGMERTAQLITQVAGRAGRAKKPGHVLLQTYHPDHAAIECLCNLGYEHFAIDGLAERKSLSLPPFYHQVIVRAESGNEQEAMQLLSAMRNDLEPFFAKEVYLVGPYTAIIVRKAGQHRALISIKAAQRGPLHQATQMMTEWLEQSTKQHRIRFAIDVDPLETY